MRVQSKAGRGEPAYIGLGANLDDPARQLRKALSALSSLPSCRLLSCSSLYRTPPLGPPNQPEYVNGAAMLKTELPPLDLLDALQEIECSQGRCRGGERWGPRTLDLDLLLYGSRTVTGGRLCLPHPQMHLRAFVLVPLAEIAPAGLYLPGIGTLENLLQECNREGITLVQGSAPWQNADHDGATEPE